MKQSWGERRGKKTPSAPVAPGLPPESLSKPLLDALAQTCAVSPRQRHKAGVLLSAGQARRHTKGSAPVTTAWPCRPPWGNRRREGRLVVFPALPSLGFHAPDPSPHPPAVPLPGVFTWKTPYPQGLLVSPHTPFSRHLRGNRPSEASLASPSTEKRSPGRPVMVLVG